MWQHRLRRPFMRRPFHRHCEHGEAIQPMSMVAIFINFFALKYYRNQPTYTEFALRLRSWIAAPLVAARDDGGIPLSGFDLSAPILLI